MTRTTELRRSLGDEAAAPRAHGRIGREQSRQGRLRRHRGCFDAPLSAGGPVGRGGEQAVDVAGQRRQGAGAIGRFLSLPTPIVKQEGARKNRMGCPNSLRAKDLSHFASGDAPRVMSAEKLLRVYMYPPLSSSIFHLLFYFVFHVFHYWCVILDYKLRKLVTGQYWF